ncbi:MAG: HAD family hydrolase [Myxococcota bacterium]|nr:HAD family hydrolase [Myxococcota bacterium]
MVNTQEEKWQTCPHCTKAVDPLRAPAVTVVEGRIVHFCSPECRAGFLQRTDAPSTASEKKSRADDEEHTGAEGAAEETAEGDSDGGADEGADEGAEKATKKTAITKTKTRSGPRSSPLVRNQLIRTAPLACVLILIFANPPFLTAVVAISLVGALAIGLTAIGIIKERRSSTGRIAQAVAVPLVSLFLLGTIAFGGSVRSAVVSAAWLMFIEAFLNLLERLARKRSGVLANLEGIGETPTLSRSWRDNAIQAIRIHRISLILGWARFPIAIGIGLLAFVFDVGAIAQAMAACATVFLALNPRTLKMTTYDAYVSAALTAAHRGVIVRDANTLDTIATARVVVFMPQGTLLEDRLTVVDWQAAGRTNEAEVIDALASLEMSAKGRIASAMMAFTKDFDPLLEPVEDVSASPGSGISGTTPIHRVICGSRSYLLHAGISTALLDEWAAGIEASGRRAVFVALDDEVAGAFGIEEPPVPDAATVIQRLKRLGMDPAMISPAEVNAAQALGTRMGIEYVRFETSREDIGTVLSHISATGDKAVLVGHGQSFEENLDLAAVAIALGSPLPTQAGVDARHLKIDIVPWLVNLAQGARRAAHINVILASAAMALGLGLALSWTSPIAAAVSGTLSCTAAALSTLNGPYPCLAQMKSRITKGLKSLKQLGQRRLTI